MIRSARPGRRTVPADPLARSPMLVADLVADHKNTPALADPPAPAAATVAADPSAGPRLARAARAERGRTDTRL